MKRDKFQKKRSFFQTMTTNILYSPEMRVIFLISVSVGILIAVAGIGYLALSIFYGNARDYITVIDSLIAGILVMAAIVFCISCVLFVWNYFQGIRWYLRALIHSRYFPPTEEELQDHQIQTREDFLNCLERNLCYGIRVYETENEGKTSVEAHLCFIRLNHVDMDKLRELYWKLAEKESGELFDRSMLNLVESQYQIAKEMLPPEELAGYENILKENRKMIAAWARETQERKAVVWCGICPIVDKVSPDGRIIGSSSNFLTTGELLSMAALREAFAIQFSVYGSFD